MSNLRGNAALHCVVTTYKGRGPDIRYYLAVYTEDLDHYNEIPLTSQQWRHALTTSLPITYFDQTGDSNGSFKTQSALAEYANSPEHSRYVRTPDVGVGPEHAQAGVDHSGPRGTEGNRDDRAEALRRSLQDVPAYRG